MINNLFSIFDPSSLNNIRIIWFSILFRLIFLTNKIYTNNSRSFYIIKIFKETILKEIIIITKNKKTALFFQAVFLFLVIINFLRLIPYIFTPTSHLTTTLPIALPCWLSFIILGWIFNTNHIFTHLVPLNTPILLINFIVLIETISNIIRPITLSVRLIANITAGHLIINLLSNLFYKRNLNVFIILFIIQILLITLEIAVAIIQSYVLIILSTLYSREI